MSNEKDTNKDELQLNDSFFFQSVVNPYELEVQKSREDLKEKLRETISSKLAEKAKDENLFGTKNQETIRKVINWITEIIAEEEDSKKLPRKDKTELIRDVFLEITSLGKLHNLMEDESVSEIMVNAPNEVWIERKGRLIRTPIIFRNNNEVSELAKKIVQHVGRRVDNTQPIVDARLPNGSRVHVVLPPIAMKGTTITIRKFSEDKLTIHDLISFGTISPKAAKFIESAVLARSNIIISGGTGSGKTTTLNVCSNFVPDHERVITIEDSAELQLNCAHVVKLESRDANAEGKGAITIRDCIKASLRMRPERIIVGEVRDGSAFDLMQACNTGHDGSMGTTHSNSPEACIARLDNLILQAGFDLPAKFIRQTIADAIDIIVQISRLKDGTRKITHITEVVEYLPQSEMVRTENIFEWRMTGTNEKGKMQGDFVFTNYIPTEVLRDKFEKNGLSYNLFMENDDTYFNNLYEKGELF